MVSTSSRSLSTSKLKQPNKTIYSKSKILLLGNQKLSLILSLVLILQNALMPCLMIYASEHLNMFPKFVEYCVVRMGPQFSAFHNLPDYISFRASVI